MSDTADPDMVIQSSPDGGTSTSRGDGLFSGVIAFATLRGSIMHECHDMTCKTFEFHTNVIADVPTEAGRTITRAALEKAIEDFNARDERDRLGSTDPNPGINLATIAYVVESVYLDSDGTLSGKARFLDTPMGTTLQNMSAVEFKYSIDFTIKYTTECESESKIIDNLDLMEIIVAPITLSASARFFRRDT